jgi:predicted metal-binding membrane protein
MTEAVKTFNRTSWRRLRIIIVATLIALTVQGWTGDATNLFSMFPSGSVEQSLNGIFNGVLTTGFFLVWHTFEGIAIFALSLVVLAFSIKAKPKSVRICAILGLVYVVVAGVGGLLFVLSGFTNNGNSAQMGGGFIGAYAFYFTELYYAK